jgi:hypothetical protein
MIAVEVILAAVVEDQGGVVRVNAETFEKDLSQYVLAMDFDSKAEQLVITLVDKDTAVYDEDDE